jgi:hypothetical protein
MRTRDRNRRPKCLEPIRAAAVDFALKEKARSRTPTAKIAERMEIQRKHLTDVLCDLQRGDVDGTGLEYLFRIVEALDHDVVVSFVPRRPAIPQVAA